MKNSSVRKSASLDRPEGSECHWLCSPFDVLDLLEFEIDYQLDAYTTVWRGHGMEIHQDQHAEQTGVTQVEYGGEGVVLNQIPMWEVAKKVFLLGDNLAWLSTGKNHGDNGGLFFVKEWGELSGKQKFKNPFKAVFSLREIDQLKSCPGGYVVVGLADIPQEPFPLGGKRFVAVRGYFGSPELVDGWLCVDGREYLGFAEGLTNRELKGKYRLALAKILSFRRKELKNTPERLNVNRAESLAVLFGVHRLLDPDFYLRKLGPDSPISTP